MTYCNIPFLLFLNIEAAVVTKDTSQNEEQMQCYSIMKEKVGHYRQYADIF